MKKTILYMVMAMLCLFFKVNAQDNTITIKGKIIDELEMAIPNSTVSAKGENLHTIANTNGTFTLSGVHKGSTIIITSIGYKTKEIRNVQNSEVGNIILTIDNNQLKEVEIVHTGYQNIPKERVTGSFAQPNSTMFEARVAPDIISKLDGITSGLVFNKNTVNSNAGKSDLSVRGRSTIFANDQPLIVIDNFPYNGDINAINPNDVASITVLKDAAAASIWGVRAGNGVIVITTKKGSGLQPLSISLNTNVTTSGKPDLFYNQNYLSSTDYIGIEAFIFDKGKYNAALNNVFSYPVVSPVVKLLDQKRKSVITAEDLETQLNGYRLNDIRNDVLANFYRRAVAQQYAVSFSGGYEKVNYYFSSGFDKMVNSQVANENNRLTLNSYYSYKTFKNLELTAGIYYVKGYSSNDNTLSATTSGSSYLPYLSLKDNNGNNAVVDKDYSAAYKQQALNSGFLDWSFIPLNELGLSPAITKRNDIRINGGLKYTVLPGLSTEVKYQYQQILDRGRTYQPLEAYNVRNLINRYSIISNGKVSGYNIPNGGILSLSNGNVDSKNLRAQLGYEKEWGRHAVSAIAGYELGESSFESSGAILYGYNDELGTSSKINAVGTFPLNPSGSGSINTSTGIIGTLDRMRSIFANAAYTYDEKYTVSGSARVDGSNYFGIKTNQKNIPLWSAGLLWDINKESFYNLDWLPTLKLRYSYGYNGNLEKSNTGITTFKYNPLGASYTNLTFSEIINIGNPQLRWETIGISNLGLDFGSHNQRLSGTIEYYIKKGKDILGDRPFAASTGISTLRGNYSGIKTRGLDFILNSQNIRGKLNWTTSLLLSFVWDKVTQYDVVDPYSSNYVGTANVYPVINRPVYGIYSYKWAGLDPENGDPRGYLHGEISKEYSVIINNTSLDELKYHGSARPTLFGGIYNNIGFHKFNLGFNIGYKLGYYFRRPTVNYYGMYNIGITQSMNKDFERRWKQSGDETFTDVPSMGVYSSSSFRDAFYRGTSVTVEKGDHIRLQDISFGYLLDRSLWKDMPIKQVQVFIYVNNVGLLWKANDAGLDPDMIPGAGNNLAVPAPRTISFGLKTNL